MKKIRESKFTKIVAYYLMIMIFLQVTQPLQIYALTGGPAQPEFSSFTPIGTSDMVDLASGDFSYNIPVMDVGGYPLNLAYNSGITMDQEASWVGLGWDFNVGQINRQVRGLPDDFDGDKVTYENNIRDNITVGASLRLHPAVGGTDLGLQLAGANLAVEFNNYQGITFKPSVGISYQFANNVSVGMDLSTSTTEGATVKPNLSISEIVENKDGKNVRETKSSYGLSFNSRKGITDLSIYNNLTKSFNAQKANSEKKDRDVNFSLSFAQNTYTPNKRTPYKNTSVGFNASLGTEVLFGEFQGEIYGYATVQKMKDRITHEKVYGYEHTENASKKDVLDFNRENDRTLSKNTSALPITNYTYDLYSINGQGIGGSFRPFRSQVGYVYDKRITDFTADGALGLEFGPGFYAHIAGDVKFTPSFSSTGLWEDSNPARKINFTEAKKTENPVDYEKVYFKNIGEAIVDKEFQDVFTNKLGGYAPIRLGIEGFILDKMTIPNKYFMGVENTANTTPPRNTTFFSKIKREKRLVRKQAIQKLSLTDLQNSTQNYSPENKPIINTEAAKPHHTVGVNVVKEDGARYLYNQPLYNTRKIEATFNVSVQGNDDANCKTGLVPYNPGTDNSIENGKGKDHFFNRISTPAYAHTYLLSNVLSTDYQDLTNNGPTDDDLGTYTKFIYTAPTTYKWRVPFEKNTATLNEGLYSASQDQTGSYNYGEKELMYIDKIVTKTHVAVFITSPRNDAYGVGDENGGLSSLSRMKKLDEVRLYSKPEYLKLKNGDNTITPIKIAHFEYDYSLCKGVPNNGSGNGDGKLTLKKVYFTYRGSNMGKYTPYTFKYEKDYDNDGIIDNNPDYDIKGYNIWGNYKENMANKPGKNCGIMGEITNSEFPYVEQKKEQEDINAAAWSLVEVGLPSGGTIKLNYESDDYQYVQNKKALQMFKIIGASKNNDFSTPYKATLFTKDDDNEINFIYIKVDELVASSEDFKKRYIGDLQDKVVYFRFLLNMIQNTSKNYDYVTGYFKLGNKNNYQIQQQPDGTTVIAIPVQRSRIEGGFSGKEVNPFSKAGWEFARTYLTRLAYSQNGSEYNTNVLSIIDDIKSQIKGITEIFKGPNKYLRDQFCADTFIPNKSWIRLQNPNGKKLGGGIRVSKIEMSDEWDVMTAHPGKPVYKMSYGQEYSYTMLDGKSSGVATFEPEGGKENPFVVPFDDLDFDRLLAPADKNYVEGPLGSSFFPAPKVTYSRVTVKNLERTQKDDNGLITKQVGKHATGMVINEFYTSKDFPTITRNTVVDKSFKEVGTGAQGALLSFFNLNVYTDTHLALSQGFTVILNDMDGKMKSQSVYPNGALGSKDAISAVEYKYHTTDKGELQNELQVYDKDGATSKQTVGVHYDVVNDFRTSTSGVASAGADFNLAIVPAALAVPLSVPSVSNVEFSYHRNTMRSAVTTKVIYKTGLLKEKIVYDLGASVSTKNLAYDALTGEVLLTETTNEFKEHYFNLNYPAYWAYRGMGQASNNLDLEINFQYSPTSHCSFNGSVANRYLMDGDEVWLKTSKSKCWVVNVGKYNPNSFDLMNDEGKLYGDASTTGDILKIMRSGYRNLHTASMASVTAMKNPLVDSSGIYQNFGSNTLVSTDWNAYRVISTSAVKYSDTWPSQCECGLPKIFIVNDKLVTKNNTPFNPYRFNVKGNWRAKSSYAYLAGRHNGSLDPNPRNSGFLVNHTPFYRYNGNIWSPQEADRFWKYASEVTKYSPYGLELENKDALKRYSSAQYGYNYTFPLAVSSNSQYQEMGYDSFEDSDSQCENGHFNFKKSTAKNGGVEISKKESHSGRTSIKIKPGNIATLKSKLVACDTLSGNVTP